MKKRKKAITRRVGRGRVSAEAAAKAEFAVVRQQAIEIKRMLKRFDQTLSSLALRIEDYAPYVMHHIDHQIADYLGEAMQDFAHIVEGVRDLPAALKTAIEEKCRLTPQERASLQERATITERDWDAVQQALERATNPERTTSGERATQARAHQTS